MRDAVVFSAHTGDFLFRLWVFLLVLCFVFFSRERLRLGDWLLDLAWCYVQEVVAVFG
jgi:hypothetical protein